MFFIFSLVTQCTYCMPLCTHTHTYTHTLCSLCSYCIMLYCIVLYLYISIALLSAWAIQKHSRLKHCYCVGASTPKRYGQLQVKDLPKVPTGIVGLEPVTTFRERRHRIPTLSHHARVCCLLLLQFLCCCTQWFAGIVSLLNMCSMPVVFIYLYIALTQCCPTFLTKRAICEVNLEAAGRTSKIYWTL